MLADIFNVPAELEINNKKYKAEYDFNGFAVLETLTGKGIYKLYDLLMVQNNLTLGDSIEVICCSLLKHHTTEEVSEVMGYLQTNPYKIKELNTNIIWVFTSPLLPPEVKEATEFIKKKTIELETNQQTKN